MGADHVTVFIKYQDANLKMKINLNKTVRSLKKTIQKKIGIKKEIQQLFFLDEKELDNDKTLKEYNINNNSTLILKCNHNELINNSDSNYEKEVTDKKKEGTQKIKISGKEEGDKKMKNDEKEKDNEDYEKKEIIIKNKNEKLFFDLDTIDKEYKEKLEKYHQYINIIGINEFLGEKHFLLRIDSTGIQFKEYLSENFYFPVKRIQIELENNDYKLIEMKNDELFLKYAQEYVSSYGISGYVYINILPLENKEEFIEITVKEKKEDEYIENKKKVDIFSTWSVFFEQATSHDIDKMYEGEFLLYKGKIIQNTKPLIDDYKFKKIVLEKKFYYSDYIHSIEILVKTLTGKIIHIDTDEGEIIGIVKLKIRDKEGIPVDQQRMIYGGCQVIEHRQLRDYNIKNGSMLHLVLRLRGG